MASSLDATQEATVFEEDEDSEDDASWGRLIPLNAVGMTTTMIPGEKDNFLVGRCGNVDLVVAGDTVSQRHCRIFRLRDESGDSCAMIEDLSRHGTIVNGRVLGTGKKTLLTHGTEIFIGRTGFIFQPTISAGTSSSAHASNGGNPAAAGAMLTSPLHNKYDLQAVIGRGNFSTVRLGICKDTGKKVAVKVIEKSRFTFNTKVLDALETEVQILRKVQPHPNVVGFEDFFDERGTLYIVMEYCPSGDLLKYVVDRKYLDEPTAKKMLLQMIIVLKHLKSKGIVHRDLKPDNFLCDREVLKLADFGVAKQSENKQLSTVCGTPVYLAPEIIFSEQSYDDRVDVYSVGVILFFMLCGGIPFVAVEESDLFSKIKLGAIDWSSPNWKNVSEPAKDLVRALMRVDPDSRIKLEDVESHEWFIGRPKALLQPPPLPQQKDAAKLFGQLIQSKHIINLTLPVTRIGRTPGNDEVLSDIRISRSHCTISFEGPDFMQAILTVEGQNVITVNQMAVDKKKVLSDGDIIRLAPPVKNRPNLDYMFKMKVQAQRAAAGNTAKRRRVEFADNNDDDGAKKQPVSYVCNGFRLTPSAFAQSFLPAAGKGGGSGGGVEIHGDAITIGRGIACDVVIANAGVSGVQCKIAWNGRDAILEDFGTNDTLINRKAVGRGKQQVLHEGDVICVCPLSVDETIDFVFSMKSS